MKRKTIGTFILGILLTFGSIYAGVQISYVMNKVINEPVTVGETVLYSDGIIVELINKDDYTLTYFELDENEEQRWYVTYQYAYTILEDGLSIEVSSLTDDIIVSEISNTDSAISITFGLNQEKTFNDGDILNVQFYFEAVEVLTSLNINTAGKVELMEIGFTMGEAQGITNYGYGFDSLSDMNNKVSITNLIDRYQQLVDDGRIVFE